MTDIPTVYIIDDNEEHREILVELVELAGFIGQPFDSGTEFLKLNQWKKIGCILLDNQMPDKTGIQVQAELNKRGCDLPIIFVTGGSMISDAVRAVQEGAFGFLEKPIQSKELIDSIKKAIALCKIQMSHQNTRQEFRTSLEKLTGRERQIYDLGIRGKTNKMISTELTIKIGTVEFHRANMMEKMGVNTFSELMELTHNANPIPKN